MFKKTKVCKGLMLAFGGSLALSGLPALAQQAEQPKQLDRVEITGSSIKRIESEGALSVQTISRTEIDRLGVQSTEQLLQTVSAMSTSGQTQNSTGVGISTYGASGVSLRGLGEERTLVLLNGRRLAAFAGGHRPGRDPQGRRFLDLRFGRGGRGGELHPDQELRRHPDRRHLWTADH